MKLLRERVIDLSARIAALRAEIDEKRTELAGMERELDTLLNQRADTPSPPPTPATPPTVHSVAASFGCTRCLIKYSGGPLSLKDVEFKDCMFLFLLNSRPPSEGVTLVEALVSGEQDIRIRPNA